MIFPVGIRREDINRWERRAPLVPIDVKELTVRFPLKFIVQPSTIRVFPDEDYFQSGASVEEDLCPSRVIFALKEIPLEVIQPDKMYVFFSHTVKGQPQNMPMLKRMQALGCSIIDYERIVDSQGRRLLFFGNYAGQAGMIDTLWSLGRRLDVEGIKNPFIRLKPAHAYGSLEKIKTAILEVGEIIKQGGIPLEIQPLTFGFLGYGHVSQGAQEIFDLLPFDQVEPSDLPGIFLGGKTVSNRVYKTVFKEEHMVEPLEPGRTFNLQDYYEYPEKYRPVVENYIRYLSVVINGIYWTSKYPRFVTKAFLRKLFSEQKSPKLKIISDISCDINGSIESTVMATDPENPVYVYDPVADRPIMGFEGKGPVVLAVYNLPAELPVEASTYFSRELKKYVPEIVMADYSNDLEKCGLSDVVRRAVILYKGKLTADYSYLDKFLG